MSVREPRIEFSNRAQRDFTQIRNYSRHQWSEQQATRYMSDLSDRIDLLLQNARLGQAREDLGVGVRSLQDGQHRILYCKLEDVVLVLRILHVRQDERRAIDE
jgi:toxin ParE1/3/4